MTLSFKPLKSVCHWGQVDVCPHKSSDIMFMGIGWTNPTTWHIGIKRPKTFLSQCEWIKSKLFSIFIWNMLPLHHTHWSTDNKHHLVAALLSSERIMWIPWISLWPAQPVQLWQSHDRDTVLLLKVTCVLHTWHKTERSLRQAHEKTFNSVYKLTRVSVSVFRCLRTDSMKEQTVQPLTIAGVSRHKVS